MLFFLLEDYHSIPMEAEKSNNTAAPRKVCLDTFHLFSIDMAAGLFKLCFLMNCYELLQMRFAPRAPPRRVPKPEIKTYVIIWLNRIVCAHALFCFL
jgi:hypothetical protein